MRNEEVYYICKKEVKEDKVGFTSNDFAHDSHVYNIFAILTDTSV